MKNDWIRWLENCTLEDVPLVGGKGASLGELRRAGKNVPPGFAITVKMYQDFLAMTGLGEKITSLINKMSYVDKVHTVFNEPPAHAELSRAITEMFENTQVPAEIEDAIASSYQALAERSHVPEVWVAVRSSATVEDSTDSSFAGLHETYLNVKGAKDVIDKTLKCWSSLYSVRALNYRLTKKISHDEALMGVIVQKMVDAKTAGVTFTVDPITGDTSRLVVEGAWGLGEGVVSGYVTPDHYALNKTTLDIVEEWISPKLLEFAKDPLTGATVQREVPVEKQNIPALSKDELQTLARMALSIESYYGIPQDIEWAIDRDLPFPENIIILQSRPVTVWGGVRA